MDTKERRRYEQEKKKQARLEEDLESEKLLRDELEYQKRFVKSAQPNSGLIVIERLRGLVRLETGDIEQDYQLTVTHDECTLKPMKNQKNRLNEQDYGFLVYGRNVGENDSELLKEVLKTCRTQLR